MTGTEYPFGSIDIKTTSLLSSRSFGKETIWKMDRTRNCLVKPLPALMQNYSVQTLRLTKHGKIFLTACCQAMNLLKSILPESLRNGVPKLGESSQDSPLLCCGLYKERLFRIPRDF